MTSTSTPLTQEDAMFADAMAAHTVTSSVAQNLTTYLAANSERDALISGIRHHLRMSRAARRIGASSGLYRTHRTQVATYRRMLLNLSA